jgi:hypothetical protein
MDDGMNGGMGRRSSVGIRGSVGHAREHFAHDLFVYCSRMRIRDVQDWREVEMPHAQDGCVQMAGGGDDAPLGASAPVTSCRGVQRSSGRMMLLILPLLPAADELNDVLLVHRS